VSSSAARSWVYQHPNSCWCRSCGFVTDAIDTAECLQRAGACRSWLAKFRARHFLIQARLVEPELIRGALGHLLRVWVDDYVAPFMQPDAEGGKWEQVFANLQRPRGML